MKSITAFQIVIANILEQTHELIGLNQEQHNLLLNQEKLLEPIRVRVWRKL
jgi:hypothetical protein